MAPADSRSKSSTASGRTPRPPRLRDACNQCHAAKVKCSGDKDGCSRCQLLSLSCHYSESRAGKVPGKRARKPAAASSTSSLPLTQPETPQAEPPRDARKPLPTQIFGSLLEDPDEAWDQPDPRGFAMTEQDHIGWSPGLSFDMDYGCDVPGEPSVMASPRSNPPQSHPPNHRAVSQGWLRSGSRLAQESSNGQATQQHANPPTPPATTWAQGTPAPAFAPSLTFSGSTEDDRQSWDCSVAVHSDAPEGEGQLRTTSRPPPPSHADEAQCIQVCAEIVESLQGYLVAELKVIDIVLPTVFQTLTTLQSLLDSRRQPAAPCSLHYQSILLACILQLVELISMGCQGLREEHAAASTRVSQSPAALGMGLSLNAAERRDRKAAKVLEQLRGVRGKIGDVLTKASLTSRAAPLQPAAIVASFDRSVYELRQGIRPQR